MINFKLLLIIALSFTVTLFTLAARGHEGDGFTHMTESSGPLIGQKSCGNGMTVWYHDDNEDAVVDRCSLVIFNHGRIHTAPARIDVENEDCLCEVAEVVVH